MKQALIDDVGLFATTGRAGGMDVAAARWAVGWIAGCWPDLKGDDPADLKKNDLKPWLQQCWCIPPSANADFVCAMEDVLDAIDLYSTPKNESKGRSWQIPKGMDEDDFIDHLIHKGALHKEKDKRYHCQIPSFAQYLIERGEEAAPRQEMKPTPVSEPDDYEPGF